MQKLKVAVVGAGFMGQLHARTVNECETAELVAVVDLNKEIGQAVADKLGTRYVENINALLEEGAVDAFVVALPDRLHVDTASSILLAGKPLLLEKPMADTLDGALQIAEAAKKGGGRVMVGHVLRFDPRYVQAAEAVAKGEIGDVIHVTAKRYNLKDVGLRLKGKSSVCFYMGIHDVDAMQWVSGKKITNVFARSVSKIMSSQGIDSEDAIFANFEYEDGSIGSLGLSWALPANMPSGLIATLEIVGTKGVIQLDASENGLRLVTSSSVNYPDGMHWPEVNGKIAGDLKEEIAHFVKAVRDNTEFLMTEQDALQSVAVNDAILKSVETGLPVEVKTI